MSSDLVDALGERLLRASGTLMDLELIASNEGSWKQAMRLRAKRSGVELALSYLNEELRMREHAAVSDSDRTEPK